MILPSAWPQVLDYFRTPLVVELWPGPLSRDAGLLPLRQLDQRIELTRALTQALDDPGGADLTRALLSRASAQTSWQQNGNNIGRVSPTRLQCHWHKSGDVTVCHTSNLTVSPSLFPRPRSWQTRRTQDPLGGNPRVGSNPTAGILNNPNSSGRPRNSQGKAHIITERGLEVRFRGLRPIRDGFALKYVSSGL